jgi:hypothetical protein
MLLAEISIQNLKKVSSKIWNGPLDSMKPWFYFVEVVGSFEDYHVMSVCGFFFWVPLFVLLFFFFEIYSRT